MTEVLGQLSFSLASADDPVDHLDRQRAIADLSSTMLVEAGAGTGKTRVLVSRIVELVMSRTCELREVAAITFTEAAALELRDRIRAAFLERLDSSTDTNSLAHALDQLDEAAIGTIHGFAYRILAEHPLEARLPLRFEVIDEIASEIEFERRFSVFLDALFDEPGSRSTLAGAMLLGATAPRLRELMWSFAQSAERSRAASSSTDLAEEPQQLVARHCAALSTAIAQLEALGANCLEPDDRLLARIAGLVGQLELVSDAEDWLDQLSWIVSFVPQRVGNVGRQGAWPNGALDAARGAFEAFERARSGAIDEIGAAISRRLAQRLGVEAVSWAEQRREQGRLHFDDLLCLARDLLRDDEHVRTALGRRYHEILVDEFQDTDPLQLEIVKLIKSEGTSSGLPARGLFFVGDPRQSIYRFRGAGLSSYQQARDELLTGEPVELVMNFRSRPGVIEFVNHVFGRLMTTEDGDRPLFPPLVASRREDESSSVVLTGGAVDQRAHERRETESADLAETIGEAIREPWLVEEDGALRPARYSDIVILFPRRTGLSELEGALDGLDIPYRVASSTLIYASNEVRDLLSCLRAIGTPADERALVAALRTPFFGCGDDDLYAYRTSGGWWRLDARTPEGELSPGTHRVVEGLVRLRRYSARKQLLGPLGVLDAFIAEEQVQQILSMATRGPEALRRVQFLRARSQAFVEAGGQSLPELLEWIDLEANSGARGVEVVLDDDADAVRILTIHGAKGLEFPIVLLAELGGAIRTPPRGATVLDNPEGGVELRVAKELQSAGFADLSDDEALLDRAEAIRLAYVGMTRAKDHLVVSLHHQPSANGPATSLAEIIAPLCEDMPVPVTRREPDSALSLSPVARPTDDRLVEGPGESASGYLAAQSAWQELEHSLAAARSVAASALDAHDELSPDAPYRADSEDAARWWHGPRPIEIGWDARRAATAIGRAVHAVLQRIDLHDPVELEGLVERAAIDEHCEGAERRIASLVTRTLAAPVIAQARLAERCYRELPISTIIDGGLLESVLDLCFLTEDGYVIVDYKTDTIDPRMPIDAHGARYRLQAGAYALALESLRGQHVARVVLLFANGERGALECEIHDLADATREARVAIGARFSAEVVRS